jgi:hypothetical protein
LCEPCTFIKYPPSNYAMTDSLCGRRCEMLTDQVSTLVRAVIEARIAS